MSLFTSGEMENPLNRFLQFIGKALRNAKKIECISALADVAVALARLSPASRCPLDAYL